MMHVGGGAHKRSEICSDAHGLGFRTPSTGPLSQRWSRKPKKTSCDSLSCVVSCSFTLFCDHKMQQSGTVLRGIQGALSRKRAMVTRNRMTGDLAADSHQPAGQG